jgi:hypothetical protein
LFNLAASRPDKSRGRPLYEVGQEEERVFFFEKKNQKTFTHGIRLPGYGRDSGAKVFCFFSSERRPSFPSPTRLSSRQARV